MRGVRVMTDVIRVPYVYGGHYHVAVKDLESSRVLLPIYTRDGRPWTDTKAGERAARTGKATRLHRDNIGPRITEGPAQ